MASKFYIYGMLMGGTAYLLSWFPLMSICLLLSSLFNGLVKQSCIDLFNYPLFRDGCSDIYLTSDRTMASTYDSTWYQRWIHNGISMVVMGRAIYLLSWSSLFFTLGYYRFKKKEY